MAERELIYKVQIQNWRVLQTYMVLFQVWNGIRFMSNELESLEAYADR